MIEGKYHFFCRIRMKTKFTKIVQYAAVLKVDARTNAALFASTYCATCRYIKLFSAWDWQRIYFSFEAESRIL
jgi:hypothetical protein